MLKFIMHALDNFISRCKMNSLRHIVQMNDFVENHPTFWFDIWTENMFSRTRFRQQGPSYMGNQCAKYFDIKVAGKYNIEALTYIALTE